MKLLLVTIALIVLLSGCYSSHKAGPDGSAKERYEIPMVKDIRSP